MASTPTPVAPIPLIDWTVLGQVLAVSLALGIGLVTVFSLGLTALSFARNESASPLSRTLGRLGVAVTALGVATVLAWGFYIITQKG